MHQRSRGRSKRLYCGVKNNHLPVADPETPILSGDELVLKKPLKTDSLDDWKVVLPESDDMNSDWTVESLDADSFEWLP